MVKVYCSLCQHPYSTNYKGKQPVCTKCQVQVQKQTDQANTPHVPSVSIAKQKCIWCNINGDSFNSFNGYYFCQNCHKLRAFMTSATATAVATGDVPVYPNLLLHVKCQELVRVVIDGYGSPPLEEEWIQDPYHNVYVNYYFPLPSKLFSEKEIESNGLISLDNSKLIGLVNHRDHPEQMIVKAKIIINIKNLIYNKNT